MDPILKGIITGFGLSLLLGPVFFAILQSSISKGFKAGLSIILGVIFSELIYASVALIFNEIVATFVKKNEVTITIIGGIVLIGFGLYGIFGNKEERENAKKNIHSKGFSTWLLFSKGIVLNALNPANFLIWVVLIINLPLEYSLSNRISYVAAAVFTLFITEATLAFGAGKVQRFLTPKRILQLNNLVSFIFVAIGIWLILKGMGLPVKFW